MTSQEWIELFFSKAFENQINDLILEDIDYEIPRESIHNYVLHVIDVPYEDYLDYVSNLELKIYDKFDIPYFEQFAYCESDLIEYIISQDNNGCTEEEIGKYLARRARRIAGSTSYFGSRHLYSAKIMGLVYEYYNHWYINCLGYVYGSLNNKQRFSLLARTILRSPFYMTLFYNIKTHAIYIENYMKMFTDRFVKIHLKSILFFSDICVKEAQESNIKLKIKSLSKKYKTIGDILNVDKIIPCDASRSLRLYFDELKNYPIITENEIRRLLKVYRNGNKDSINLIVKASQLTVVRIAQNYKFAPLEDIIQEANIGVMNAIKNYDFDSVYSFYGFLSFWVKRHIQSIQSFIPSLVRFPVNVVFKHYVMRKSFEHYVQVNEITPSIDDIDFGEEKEWEQKEFLYNLPDKLSDTVSFDDMDSYESDTQQTGWFQDTEYDKFYVTRLLHHLLDREEDMVRLYFGIDVEQETLNSIGEMFNLTRERARQIVSKAVRKLRSHVKENEFRDNIISDSVAAYEVKALDVATIGDYVDVPQLKQLGKVVNTVKLRDDSILYVMGVLDRKIFKITKDGVIKSDENKKKHAKSEKLPIERRTFLKSLNGNNKKAKKTNSTYKKHVQHDIQPAKPRVTKPIVPSTYSTTYWAKVGDRIIYDKKPCVVLEKKVRQGYTRLVIMYDNGTIDNVPDERKRYKFI